VYIISVKKVKKWSKYVLRELFIVDLLESDLYDF
jgi:hypothetical protein